MKCEICEKQVKNFLSLSIHLTKSHNISKKEYYDQYLKKDNDGICVCGNKTNFQSISLGYRKYCSVKCARNSNEVLEKYKQTCIEKYGTSHPSKSNIIKEKVKQTCIKRFGVENPYQSKEIQEKIKKTNLENHGVENPGQIVDKKDDRLSRMKETMMKRYGVDSSFHTQSAKEKRQNIRLNKLFERIKKFKITEPLFDKNNFISILDEYEWKCLKCRHIFKDNLIGGKTPLCPKCFPKTGGKSIIEAQFQDWLSNIIEIERNKFFIKNNKRFELDVFIPSKNIGIEFDGIWWHSELAGKNKNYHIDKTNWFKENFDIDVIHVFENEWILKQDIVKSMIKAKLGLIENRIYARKCKIVNLTNKESREFLEDNHIQGNCNGSIKLGLKYNNKIVMSIVIGKPRFSKKYDLELIRLCSKKNLSVVGGFSKLLSEINKTIDYSKLVSYCDRRWSNGIGYQNVGFKQKGISSPNYWYFHKIDITLHNRIQFQKHKLSKLLETFDPDLTEWENMQMNGWNRIWDCGNFCFSYLKSI